MVKEKIKSIFNNKDNTFTPKFFSLLKKGITKDQILKDSLAGVTVGIVALPLAIAFAIASGVTPDKGLITAIIAGIVISVFGGSRVQIGGPTGAFIVIVYSIVQSYGVDGLIVATFMAGFILIIMGLAKLGNLLKYVSHPLIVGFTSGIALIIFSSQIKDFFGLKIDKVPANFLEKWYVYFQNFNNVNWYAVIIAVLTIIITFNYHRFTRNLFRISDNKRVKGLILVYHNLSKRIPGSIIAIIVSTLAVYFFKIPVATIESAFGEIPSSLSMPSVPNVDFETFKMLIQPAFAIALLGGIESLLSAVVADGMTGSRHRSNIELIAQGGANCLSAMFGGIPATGAIARTATNIKNGGKTPISGIVHALTLLLIMLLFAPYAKLIPMACLAGILIVVSYNMSEWRLFVALLKENKSDVLVMLTTFFLTVVFDLVIAIQIGIVLSSFMVMKRMSDSVKIQSSVDVFNSNETGSENLFDDELSNIPKNILVYEINGPLFFGATQKFQDIIDRSTEMPDIIILRMRNVPFIDATGIHRLKDVAKKFREQNIVIILSGVRTNIRTELMHANVQSIICEQNILSSFDLALQRADEILNVKKIIS